MTLATIDRYDPDRMETVGDHAVVIGGSIAGLCASRVLADGFKTVTVVERENVRWNGRLEGRELGHLPRRELDPAEDVGVSIVGALEDVVAGG